MGIAFNGREIGGLAFNGREIESGYINGRKVFPTSKYSEEYIRNIMDNLNWVRGTGNIYSDNAGGFIIANYLENNKDEILVYNKKTTLWNTVTLPNIGKSFEFFRGYSGVLPIEVNQVTEGNYGFLYSKDGGYTWTLYPWQITNPCWSFASDGKGAYFSGSTLWSYYVPDLLTSKPQQHYDGAHYAYCYDGIYYLVSGTFEYSLSGGSSFSKVTPFSSYHDCFQGINIVNGKVFATLCSDFYFGTCNNQALYYLGKPENIYSGKPITKAINLGETYGEADPYKRINAYGICYCDILECFMLFIPGKTNFNWFSFDGKNWKGAVAKKSIFETVYGAYYVPGQGFYVNDNGFTNRYYFAEFKG